jgi:hypothetical protein
VERFFNKTGKLSTYYVGLTKIGTLLFWADGTTPGTGITSNDPYGEGTLPVLQACPHLCPVVF